ncbi:MAG: hypothetical protein PVF83_01585 [Anaerolineales bacterium]|jgi:hypothetical protein
MAEKKDSKMKSPYRTFISEEAAEHMKAARAELRQGIAALFPPEFVAHHRAARREMLLAAREILNHKIERMEAEGKT